MAIRRHAHRFALAGLGAATLPQGDQSNLSGVYVNQLAFPPPLHFALYPPKQPSPFSRQASVVPANILSVGVLLPYSIAMAISDHSSLA